MIDCLDHFGIRIFDCALLFGEQREVGWSFWAGLVLIIISVLLQTRRVAR